MLHGGTIPLPYLDVIMMRELHLRPHEIGVTDGPDAQLTAGQLVEYLACLQGELRARRVLEEQRRFEARHHA